MSNLKIVDEYKSRRTSLVYMTVDGILYISAVALRLNGEIGHELFSREYTDSKAAARVFVKLEEILKVCDKHLHYTTFAVLKSYADEAMAS